MFMKHIIALIALTVLVFSDVISQDTISITLGSDQLKDAYINIVNTETDGECESLIASVWTYWGEFGMGRSLFGFDFTDFRDNAVIIDARLNLYHDSVSGHMGHSTIGGDNSGMIFRITEPWIEDSVTWANQPSTTNTNAIIIPAPDSSNANFANIDITPIIKDMIRHPESSDGFMIKLASEESLYRSLVFASSDHADQSIHPSIEITYVTDPPMDSITLIQPNNETGNDASVFSLPAKSVDNTDQSLVSMVWEQGHGWVIGRSFIGFDLSEINPNHTITYAELSLFHDSTSQVEGHIDNGGLNELVISRIIAEWNDIDLSWENQPLTTEDNQVLVTSSNISNQDYLDINVTELVKDMSVIESSFGFSIQLADETTHGYDRNVVFASSNHSNSNLHPKLVVYTQDVTGIDNSTTERNELLVYPNPGSGIFKLELPVGITSGELVVMDNSGRVVKKQLVENHIQSVDLSTLPSGIYHFRFSNETRILNTKVVKY